LVETVGCDINAQDNGGDTPLHIVLEHFNPNKGGDITALTYLINQNNVNVNIKNRKGFNLLYLACICDFTDSKDDFMDSEYDFMDSEYEFTGSEHDLHDNDTILYQIVEVIVQRSVQHILDGETR
jgi:ankyrin repeat protein